MLEQLSQHYGNFLTQEILMQVKRERQEEHSGLFIPEEKPHKKAKKYAGKVTIDLTEDSGEVDAVALD